MVLFTQSFATGLMIGGIYAILALGFVVIYKSCKIFNFAQGELLLVGAYVSWACVVQLHLPIWAGILIMLLFAVALGFGIERFPLRPMIGQPPLAIIMVTLGLAILLRSLIIAVWGGVRHPYPEIFPLQPVTIGAITLSQQHIWSFMSCIAFLIMFAIFFRFTNIGLLLRAVAEDHILAKSTGVNVRRFIGLSWAISATVASAGGIFLGSINGVSPALADFGLKAIAAALVGGLESALGAVLGGLLIGVVEILSTTYIGQGVGEVAAFFVLVLALFIRPYGLFGLVKIERV